MAHPWDNLGAAGQRSGTPRRPQNRQLDISALMVEWALQPGQSGLTSHPNRDSTLGGAIREPRPLVEAFRRSGLYSQVDAPNDAPTSRATTYKSEWENSTMLGPHKRPEGRMLVTDRDKEMASRQTRIETLSGQARKEQENWAQRQLKLSGVCIGGYKWDRVDGGYRCKNKRCLVTDELLAEGRGGYYEICNGRGPFQGIKPSLRGPHYPVAFDSGPGNTRMKNWKGVFDRGSGR